MVRRQKPDRKKQFRAACELAGTTPAQWARVRGYSSTHLYLVLDGQRKPGDDLASEIARFIDEHLAASAAA